jgi:hypothetical protein
MDHGRRDPSPRAREGGLSTEQLLHGATTPEGLGLAGSLNASPDNTSHSNGLQRAQQEDVPDWWFWVITETRAVLSLRALSRYCL